MFITFEGIEGSGKSTVIHHLEQYFQNRNLEVLVTREPGGSRLGRTLRSMLLDTRTDNVCVEAELFLFLADRAQHLHDMVLPALEEGKIVLCDRYIDSTIAYQGYGRQQDIGRISQLCQYAVTRLPDTTFLLDVPVDTGLARAGQRNRTQGTVISEGRFDSESHNFHTRVRNGYLALAEQHPRRITIIDACQNVEAVVAQCVSELEANLARSAEQ